MLRAIALIVLLINGVFLAWQLRQAPAQPERAERDKQVANIALWQELPESRLSDNQPETAWPRNPFFFRQIKKPEQAPQNVTVDKPPAESAAVLEPESTESTQALAAKSETASPPVLPVTQAESESGQTAQEQSPPNQPMAAANQREVKPPLTPAAVQICYQVGPFSSVRELNAWRKEQGIAGGQINIVGRELDVVTAYMVYYPAAETFEASLANLKILKEKGIADYWIFQTGDDKGDISLGLFTEISRAQTLYDQLKKQGLDVAIRPRRKTKRVQFAYLRATSELEDKLIESHKTWKPRHSEFAVTASQACQ